MAAAKVLVVDDDPLITRLVRFRLEAADLACDTADSAAQALRLMQGNQYLAVVADVQMPELGGVEMICALKAIDPLAQVVVLTADASVEQLTACARAGAADFLAKDGDYDRLVETVRVIVDRQRRWAELLEPRAHRPVQAGGVS